MRLGVLSSQRGTTLFSLLNAIQEKKLNAAVEVVISQNANALVLQHAKAQGLKTCCIPAFGLTREGHEEKISAELQKNNVELILLIGYMRILSNSFIATWHNKILNVHPSLLPAYAGKMDLAVHRAVLDAKERETGCTVHFVTEDVDAGPIILQKRCRVLSKDTPEILKKRVQALEAEALVEAVSLIAQ